jgi:hypothetical protein
VKAGAVGSELHAVWLTRSREGRGERQCSVFGVRCSVFRRAADGSPRVCAFSVARAFRPEICPFAALWGVSLTRSREGAKGRWSVFEYEYRPPGRTEYENERGISVRCSMFDVQASRGRESAGGSPV